MSVKIALLRGVNVGGHNKLPMKALAEALDGAGCKEVRTYIQSGNIVYRGNLNAKEFSAIIKRQFGLDIPVLILTKAAFKETIAACPFAKAATKNPKNVHLAFLAGKPAANATARFNDIKSAPEEFAFAKGVFYLHSPEGFLKSKIAEKADRILETQNTSRNWNTATKILEIAESI